LCAAVLAACSYEKNAVQDITGPNPGSAIRFFNFGVNAPSVNFYANDTKVTAVGSTTGTEATTGTAYGGVGLAGLYSAMTPGQYTLSGRIASATPPADKDHSISNLSAAIADGKWYSYYLSGFYDATAKTVDSFIVEDNLPAVDYTVAYVRFVNAISNANPMTLYAKNTTTGTEVAVGGEIPYKGAGAFTALPNATYDLSTRYAGTATNAIARTAVGFVAGRVYSISARGDITVTSTTATNRPFLDNTANR
jgi:hypothetical protein